MFEMDASNLLRSQQIPKSSNASSCMPSPPWLAECTEGSVTDGPRARVGFYRLKSTVCFANDGLWLQVPKPERKAAAAEILRDVKPSRADLYLPVNAHARVLDVIATSATPMQSAAKVPQTRPLDEWRTSQCWAH
jgi:hypothetical protein